MRSYTQQTQKCTGSSDHDSATIPDDRCRVCGTEPLRFGTTDDDGTAVILRHCPECGPYASNPDLTTPKPRVLADGGTIHTPTGTHDREQFPEVAARIGEDPARFLDIELSSDGIGTGPFALTAARIRSLESVAVVNAWLQVEADLERGPRKPVIKRLNQRKRELADQASDDEQPTGTDTEAEDHA